MGNGTPISKQTAVSIGLCIVLVGATAWILEATHARWAVVAEKLTRQGTRLEAISDQLVSVKAVVNRNTEALGEIQRDLVQLQTEVKQLQRGR